MAKPCDDSMRTHIRAHPQAFVNLVNPHARDVRQHPEKLQTRRKPNATCLLSIQVREIKNKPITLLIFMIFNFKSGTTLLALIFQPGQNKKHGLL